MGTHREKATVIQMPRVVKQRKEWDRVNDFVFDRNSGLRPSDFEKRSPINLALRWYEWLMLIGVAASVVSFVALGVLVGVQVFWFFVR